MPSDNAANSKSRWRWFRLPLLVLLVVVIVHVSGCMERLFFHPQRGATPVPREFGRGEEVWFTSRDGTKLYGWFIPAMQGRGGDSAAPAPTILHAHGNAGNILSHIWFTEYLPAAGFNLFIFDYRGYGQSEGAARRRGPLIEDTHAALDAILKRSDVDRERIGIYGQSLGAAIALQVMADRRDPLIAAAVLESPFASWRGIAACALGGDAPNAACRSLAALLIPDTHSPLEAIAKIDRPILLLHGTADSIIPIGHSRRLAEASKGNARLVEFPGGDHNTLRESHPEVERIVIEFFQRELSER